MKNKKAQLDPYTIGGIAIALLVLIIIIPLITDAISDINCQDERAELKKLLNQLSICQGSEQEANQLLTHCENQLAQLSQENNDLKEKLKKLQEDLDVCQSSKEYFPIFWLTDINLTKSWILILNISLGISIISILNILKWMFSSTNRKIKKK